MTEKNEFLYARPANNPYATCGAVTSGEGDAPEVNGGQSYGLVKYPLVIICMFYNVVIKYKLMK